MAQLVERVLGKDEVGGSNPPSSSIKSTSFYKKLVDFCSIRKCWAGCFT